MADKHDDDTDNDFPAVEGTHPLPSDMEGGSPGPANAPFAPADITPASPDDADSRSGEDSQSTSSKHSKTDDD